MHSIANIQKSNSRESVCQRTQHYSLRSRHPQPGISHHRANRCAKNFTMVQYASLYNDHFRYRPDRPYNHDKWKFLRRWDQLNGMTWVAASKGVVPPNAVIAGHDGQSRIYVGRAEVMNSVATGSVIPDKKACFVPWGGKNHKRTEYEVLCTPGKFVPIDSYTTLVQGTPGGISEQGEPLYIGRRAHEGALLCGKIQRSYFCCYLPHKTREIEHGVFGSEIFIRSK